MHYEVTTLRELRKRAFLSQQELADAAGLHRVTISVLELGQHHRRGPYPATIRRLAKALKVKPQAIEFR